jgi:Viral BACON domain/Putative binding domain, N-terminal
MRWRILGLLAGASIASVMWACGGDTNLTTSPTGCVPTLSPASQNVTSAGGDFAASITIAQGCDWTATSTDGWVTMMRASGSGSGSAAYAVAANSTNTERRARIRVGEGELAVTQSPADCSYTVDPPRVSVPASGGTADVRLDTRDGCAWSASTTDAWISLPIRSGAGPRVLAATIAANTNNAERSGVIEIAGQTVAVAQDAASQPSACSVTLSGRTFTLPVAGGSVEIDVSIGPGCSWRIDGLPDWVHTTLESASSSARPVFTVAANTTRSARTATFRIADQSVTITQGGVGCSYNVSPGSQGVGHGGGTVQFTVTAAAGCQWNASSTEAWIRVSPASGSGNGTVSVTGTANSLASRRSGSVQIADGTVRLEQDAAPCRYTLGASSTDVGVDGGSISIAVDTLDGCGWKAASSDRWIQITSASGSRDGTVSATVAAHSGATERRGTISVEGQTFTVTQAPCTYSGTWTSTATGRRGRIEEAMTAAGAGDTLVVEVSTGRECGWQHSKAPEWIPIEAGEHRGRDALKLPVSCNTTKVDRRGSMSIAGREVAIVQPFDPTGRCVR